jgi:DNA-binding NarL/FixJ family response regulator
MNRHHQEIGRQIHAEQPAIAEAKTREHRFPRFPRRANLGRSCGATNLPNTPQCRVMLKIVICDDHALFRDGLELVLAQLDGDAELAGVGDAEAALARVAADGGSDLVLLDLGLPGMSGWSALVALRRDHPDVPVVVLSGSENPEDARRALAQGAAGFIPKSTRGSVLLRALELVLAGGIYLPPLLMELAPSPAPSTVRSPLTPRQVEVLRLLARGLTNHQIGDALQIAEGTVKTHILRIYEILGVANRIEAAARLRELGLELP